MLGGRRSASEKRQALRAGLAARAEAGPLRFVGAQAPLVAMLIEDIGFDGVYVGSSTLSNDLGLPDVGLITLSEAAARGGAIAGASDLPCLLDADTGYGEAVNVARAVHALESAGLSACHIEDQVSPKRCGHLDNKQVIPAAHMAEKVRAAAAARRDDSFVIVARTDARAVEGLEAAIARGRAYAAAGADLVFPDALASADEFAQFAAAMQVPVVANMTEFGKSPLLDIEALAKAGIALVLYPATAQRLAMKAMADGLSALKQAGGQANLLAQMQTRAELYDLIRYQDYAELDERVGGYFDPT